jgi:hypothetical protein
MAVTKEVDNKLVICIFYSRLYKGCALERWFAISGTITHVILIQIATVVSSLSLCAACLPNKNRINFKIDTTNNKKRKY